jgi:hypothetical protein
MATKKITVKAYKRKSSVKAHTRTVKAGAKKKATPAKKKATGTAKKTTSKKSAYSIKKTKSGLFHVTDGYSRYGNYYKTKKGAESMLKKIRYQSGETSLKLF